MKPLYRKVDPSGNDSRSAIEDRHPAEQWLDPQLVAVAVGPALAGGLIALCGIATPFWSNVGTYLIVIRALLWWQPPAKPSSALPPERLAGAVRIGIRHAKSNPHLQAVLVRAAGFFVFASAYWALLPLLARDRIAAGPAFYGTLLGAIGAGAIGGALALP